MNKLRVKQPQQPILPGTPTATPPKWLVDLGAEADVGQRRRKDEEIELNIKRIIKNLKINSVSTQEEDREEESTDDSQDQQYQQEEKHEDQTPYSFHFDKDSILPVDVHGQIRKFGSRRHYSFSRYIFEYREKM